MFVVVLMMTGCTKIKTNKLQGFWATPSEYSEPWHSSYSGTYIPGYHYRWVIEFINSNTLYIYDGVHDINESFVQGGTVTPLSGHSGWYWEDRITCTYVFEDNKVITSKGIIYTYMDGKLYEDGSSLVYSPW